MHCSRLALVARHASGRAQTDCASCTVYSTVPSGPADRNYAEAHAISDSHGFRRRDDVALARSRLTYRLRSGRCAWQAGTAWDRDWRHAGGRAANML